MPRGFVHSGQGPKWGGVHPRSPMSYLRFVATYRSLLAFGLVMALSSSFGQTFFISLFLPHFLEDFSLTKGDFGLLYALSTLTSALSLPYLGARIDRLDLGRYVTYTLLGMTVAALTVAFAPNVAVLGLGLVGLRLTGQGLMGHISQTVMAREFGNKRGKALGVAGLGYPLGEAILPLACAAALGWLPWNWIWIGVATGALVLILPLALGLLRLGTPPAAVSAARPDAGAGQTELLRDPRLYLGMFALMAPPFVLTGLFLYQAPLSEFKGWAPEWMAAGFAAFALSRAFTTIGSGSLIDRFTALRLLPFLCVPVATGVLLLHSFSSPWVVFPYLMLTGLTAGSMANIGSAMWAEIYGVEQLGRIRGLSSASAVFAAASSPALMGYLFNRGVDFPAMMVGGVVLIALTAASGVALVLRETPSSGTRRRLARAFGR